jgi:hypothetical protein
MSDDIVDLTKSLDKKKRTQATPGRPPNRPDDDNRSGGSDSDRIDSKSHDVVDSSETDFEDSKAVMMDLLETIRSKSGDNIRNRLRAEVAHNNERQRERDKRRDRMMKLGGGDGGFRRGIPTTPMDFSDMSSVELSDEESDDESDDDESSITITKASIEKKRRKSGKSRASKRKASASVQDSSSMEEMVGTPIASMPVDAKVGGLGGGRRSQPVLSPSESDEDVKRDVKVKRAQNLTDVHHKGGKKKRKKRRGKHTSKGREDERVRQATTAENVFMAKLIIKKCKDENCNCSHKDSDVIKGHTFFIAKDFKQRKQWLLDLIMSYSTDWTHFIINRRRVCKKCFDACYAIPVR